MPAIPLAERLWLYVTPNDETGCWEWTGSRNGTGYGRLSFRKGIVLAHRMAYQVCRGDVDGHFVMHKCDNKLCVNPWHLELGDHTANMRDMMRKGRSRHPSPRPDPTKCKSGRHEWIPENISTVPTKPHGTHKSTCKRCRAELRSARYQRSATHSYTP